MKITVKPTEIPQITRMNLATCPEGLYETANFYQDESNYYFVKNGYFICLSEGLDVSPQKQKDKSILVDVIPLRHPITITIDPTSS